MQGPTWINSLKICLWDRVKEAWSCKQQDLGKRQAQAEPAQNCTQDLWVVIWFLLSWRSLDQAWAKAWLTFPLSILLYFAMESSLGLSDHKAGSLLCFLRIMGEKQDVVLIWDCTKKDAVGYHRPHQSQTEFDNLRWPLFEFLLGKVR